MMENIIFMAVRDESLITAVQPLLFCFQIVKILGKESAAVRLVTGGRAKDLSVSSEAHAFVTLRAVSWNVDEIADLAPFYVLDKPVDQFMTSG
jgi:hypothetical protein